MNWSTVRELVKINILYSNPQTVTAVKRKQEKNPRKNFSTYKSVIRQQIFLSLFFAVISFLCMLILILSIILVTFLFTQRFSLSWQP